MKSGIQGIQTTNTWYEVVLIEQKFYLFIFLKMQQTHVTGWASVGVGSFKLTKQVLKVSQSQI